MENKSMSIQDLHFSKLFWQEQLMLAMQDKPKKDVKEYMGDPKIESIVHMLEVLSKGLMVAIDEAMQADPQFVLDATEEKPKE